MWGDSFYSPVVCRIVAVGLRWDSRRHFRVSIGLRFAAPVECCRVSFGAKVQLHINGVGLGWAGKWEGEVIPSVYIRFVTG